MKTLFKPVWALVLGFAFLVSCTVAALPPYDAELIRKIDGLHAETLTLFASLEGGAPKASFSEFEDDYNALIGGFGAAKTQAEVRGVPALGQRLAQSSRFQELCPSEDAIACLNTTPDNLESIIDTIRSMRDEHDAKGMGGGVVGLFKDEYDIPITALLTIEAALER